MARITVEDCIDRVNNRFELVLLATKRARQIARGAAPMVDEEKDKPTVLALREIAAGYVDEDFMQAQDATPVVEEDVQDREAPRMQAPNF